MTALNFTGIDAIAATIIKVLIAGIENIDSSFIKGFYITGSIPLNDFHRNKSDIDFVILCNDWRGKAFRSKLESVHNKIQKSFRKPDLNGCYITFEVLQSNDPDDIPMLSYYEGKLTASTFTTALVTLFELKATAHTVSGILACDLPITIELKHVDDFLFTNINSYWKNWLRKHGAFSPGFLLLLLIPRLTEWVILGVARQLYTLETGKITSKTEAGLYCITHLPARYHAIIYEAVRVREDTGLHALTTIKASYYISPSICRAKETIDCANFIIDRFNQRYHEKYRSH